MVEYAVSDLVKEVKVLLDRNQESAGLLAPTDTDTLSQGELIQSKIVDAARIILEDAPASNLNQAPATILVAVTILQVAENILQLANVILAEVVSVTEFLCISQFTTLMCNLSQEMSHTLRSINMEHLSIAIDIR
jgi:hypothetical protein